MSETPPVAPQSAPEPKPETTAPAPTTDWQAEARKWEQRAKENKTAAEERDALKAAQMTEAEKAAARLAELESAVKGYQSKEQADAWRTEVAEATGVPAAALRGSTKEEIEAHAAPLSTLIPNPQASRGPLVPSEGSGSDAPAGVSQITDAVLATMTPGQINEARRAGRLNKILGIN